jgi:hypothetical protein
VVFVKALLFPFDDVFHHVELNKSLFLCRILDGMRVNEEEIGVGKDELNDILLILFFGLRGGEFGGANKVVGGIQSKEFAEGSGLGGFMMMKEFGV